MKDLIYEAFNKCPVRMVAGKKYCVNEITDHIPITRPELLEQVIFEMSQKISADVDILVGEEDRGGYICALLACKLGKPFTLAKWNPSGLSGDVCIKFRNLYTSGNMYINGISEMTGKKIAIVEDIIDTGGTLVAMIELLRSQGVIVSDVVAIASKEDYGGVEHVKKVTGIEPNYLVSFSSNEQETKVVGRK